MFAFQAKSALRKKHELEKRIVKKMDALQNIQILLEKIHETHNNVHVWAAYKNALAAFDTSFKDTAISESAIEDTMIKLGDVSILIKYFSMSHIYYGCLQVLDEQADIEAALARPTRDDFNDTDLEEELTELLKNDSATPPNDGGLNITDIEKDMEKVSINLPEVPDSSPDVSTQEEISLL